MKTAPEPAHLRPGDTIDHCGGFVADEQLKTAAKPSRGAIEVSTTEARGRLRDLVNRVEYAREHIVLTRHGRHSAVMLPVEDYEQGMALVRKAAEYPRKCSGCGDTIHEESSCVGCSQCCPRGGCRVCLKQPEAA